MTRQSLTLQFLQMQQFQNKAFFLLIMAAFFAQLHGQTQNNDLQLIRNHTTESHSDAYHNHHVSFLLSNHPSKLVRYNPVSLVFGSMMWTYQKIISPQFSSTCLYSPTCSGYSKNLISDFGIIRGLVYTADRLSRCNRLALMDYNSWEANSRIGKIVESTAYYKLND